MKLLLDTHLLLWVANGHENLSPEARTLISDPGNTLFFSVANLWEITIKHALGRQDFQVDIHLLRRQLLDNEYNELPIISEHVAMVSHLPPIHKDPFDRILIAQAMSEGSLLLTSDTHIAQYSGPIRKV